MSKAWQTKLKIVQEENTALTSLPTQRTAPSALSTISSMGKAWTIANLAFQESTVQHLVSSNQLETASKVSIVSQMQ